MIPKKINLEFDDFLMMQSALSYVQDTIKKEDLDDFFGMTHEELNIFCEKIYKLDTRTLEETGVTVHK